MILFTFAPFAMIRTALAFLSALALSAPAAAESIGGDAGAEQRPDAGVAAELGPSDSGPSSVTGASESSATREPPPLTPKLHARCPGCAAGTLNPFAGDLMAFELKSRRTGVHPAAQSLLTRHRWSLASLYELGVTGALTAIAGMLLVPKQSCALVVAYPRTGTGPPYVEECSLGALNYGLGAGGLGVALLGTLTYFLVRPTAGQFFDAINAYNDASPYQPFVPDLAKKQERASIEPYR